MAITIPLSKTGKNAGKYVAIVDDCDEWVTAFSWNVTKTRVLYASRTSGTKYLHREIMSHILGRPLLKTEQIDHINGNGLDNRRANIRVVTSEQNKLNRRLYANNTTGYKGVRRYGKRYKAYINYGGKAVYLGLYDTPKQAHEAYKRAAIELHREFANFGTD